jgi:hypothetical protein
VCHCHRAHRRRRVVRKWTVGGRPQYAAIIQGKPMVGGDTGANEQERKGRERWRVPLVSFFDSSAGGGADGGREAVPHSAKGGRREATKVMSRKKKEKQVEQKTNGARSRPTLRRGDPCVARERCSGGSATLQTLCRRVARLSAGGFTRRTLPF